MKRPYIPLGRDQQGRVTPTKLTERRLLMRIAEKRERPPLPELLLAAGAMEGRFRRTRPAFGPLFSTSRLPTLTRHPLHQAGEFVRTFLQYRRAGHSPRVALRIAYGCAFLGLPF